MITDAVEVPSSSYIMENVQDIFSDVELRHIVSSLRTTPLEWVGNENWSKQMSLWEQINVQAKL